MCGEQPLELYWWSAHSGSSPRVRGAVRSALLGLGFVGIIPACAGSSDCLRLHTIAHKDHPRVCGEQGIIFDSDAVDEGSSPRVRGAGVEIHFAVEGLGIIPACAGSSDPRSQCPDLTWDHPRVCGEQLCADTSMSQRSGSSPRVRGADLKIPAQNTLSL